MDAWRGAGEPSLAAAAAGRRRLVAGVNFALVCPASKMRSSWLAVSFLSGVLPCCGGSLAAGQNAAVNECSSYADCPSNMICLGASPTTTGRCVQPSHLKNGKLAHDRSFAGQLGTIYGQPMIRGTPPFGVPSAQAGGTWDTGTGTYYPPQGGGWRYQPGPNHGFGGRWVFNPALINPAPGQEVIDSTRRQ
jgi:hypothetical protein